MPAITTYLTPAIIPTYWGWTAYTPVIPKLYWDVYSQEERIKRLCLEYDKLTHYASYVAEQVNELSANLDETLTAFQDKVNAQLEEQNQLITEQLNAQNELVNQQLADMRKYIDEKFDTISEGQFIYDVTTGSYRPSKEAMRRLLQALTYNNVEDRQLVSENAQRTVEQMGAQTVYNINYSDLPNVVIDDQLPDDTI